MADIGTIIKNGEGQVDVQRGGSGNPWEYLSACASMTGPTVSFGAIETRWCQDANRAGKFTRSTRFRTAPDDITFDVMSKLTTGKLLQNLDCSFGLRARFLICEGNREDESQYDPFMLGYVPVDFTEKSYTDLVILDPNDNEEIMVTTPANAAYEYMIEKMTDSARVGNATLLGDENIVAMTFCSDANCGGNCGSRTNECSTLYMLTGGSGLYTTATLITMTKDVLTGDLSFTRQEITGGSGEAYDAIVCAGNRIIIASQSLSEVGYSDDGGATWSFVTIPNGGIGTGSLTANFLYALNSREIWLAMGAGYVYRSLDGGLSWTDVTNGGITTENLATVYAYNEDRIIVGGENGALFYSKNGGRTWVDLVDELNKAGIRVNHAVIPPQRFKEIYVALNDGRIFRSKDEGATVAGWTEVTFSGSGVGSVDKILFYGLWDGEQMWFTQTNASNQTRVLRDLSGGAGGADVEQIVGYTAIIAGGIQLNDFDICETNYGFIGGVTDTAYPVLVEMI